jgi:hypothetical protein
MRYLPNILFALSLPVGMLGYGLGVTLVTTLLPDQANGILVLFIPLFIAGLCMMPFVIPFFDRKAKRDLAAHRAEEALAKDDGQKPRKRS